MKSFSRQPAALSPTHPFKDAPPSSAPAPRQTVYLPFQDALKSISAGVPVMEAVQRIDAHDPIETAYQRHIQRTISRTGHFST